MVVDGRARGYGWRKTADVPAAAEAATVRVRMLFEVGLAGLNVAVTPVGSPDAATLTEPENPLAGANANGLYPLAACCRGTFPGTHERLKSGGPSTRPDVA